MKTTADVPYRPDYIIQGSSEPLKLLPLKLMRINGIIVPVVCNVEDAQIYALIERKEK